MAQHLENLFPRFARAGAQNSTAADAWSGDNDFDVEMLAEYLLDDGNPTQGVTFDFNIDQNQPKSFVSPENSEDGNLPPIGDIPLPNGIHDFKPSMTAYVNQQQQFQNTFFASNMMPMMTGNTTNATVTTAQSTGFSPGMGNSSAFPILPSPIPAAGTARYEQDHDKRRRLGDGMGVGVEQSNNNKNLFEGQLLAAAAQAIQPAATEASVSTDSSGRARKKSQAQIDRRRERNRILARRTRLRKKFFFESLQKEIMDLQRENLQLKEIVKENMPEDEQKRILEECDAMEKVPHSVLEACGEGAESMDSKDFNLVQSIQNSQHAFIITDPSLQDNPIVFASDAFLKLTEYNREEVLGRNCRFLQGTDTCKNKIELVRKSLSYGEDVSVTLLNYKADGTPFWNKLFIAALRDAQNNIVNYIGVIVEVAAPEPGDPEHDKALADARDAEDALDALDGAGSSTFADGDED